MQLQLTRTIKILLIAYIVVFIVQQTADRFIFQAPVLQMIFGLVPGWIFSNFYLWQIFTYAFLHADPMHLFLNCLMLAFIGGEIEHLWGRKRFLQFYFFCASMAGLFFLALNPLLGGDPSIPMVGASGSIFGLFIAYGIFFGERTLLFMMLFPMKAKHMVWLLVGVEFMTLVYSQSGGRFSSVAHIGGLGAGFFYLWFQAFWTIRQRQRKEGQQAQRRARAKAAQHLKLVISNPADVDEAISRLEESDDNGNDPKTWH